MAYGVILPKIYSITLSLFPIPLPRFVQIRPVFEKISRKCPPDSLQYLHEACRLLANNQCVKILFSNITKQSKCQTALCHNGQNTTSACLHAQVKASSNNRTVKEFLMDFCWSHDCLPDCRSAQLHAQYSVPF